jgi:hypothetical protein
MTACSGNNQTATQAFTPRPSATFTPRSTELPLVPTQVLIGSPEQPLKVLLVGERNAATNRAVTALEAALNDELDSFQLGFYNGLTVEVEVLETQEELLYRLCNSNDSVAFANAFTFYAAYQQCGAQPVLQTEREGRTGSNFELVVFRQRIFNIGNLDGRALCIKSYDDLTSFIHPALAFRANGLDPLREIESITSGFTDDAEMALAVSGRFAPGQRPVCDAAAVPVGSFQAIRNELLDPTREQSLTEQQFDNLLGVLTAEDGGWRQIPYDILVFPPDRLLPNFMAVSSLTPETMSQNPLVVAFLGINEDADEAKRELATLIPHDNIKTVQTASYTTFLAWMNLTGWSMAR